MVRIYIEAQGAKQVARHFDLSGVRAADPREAFSMILTKMMSIEDHVFSSQGRRGGGSWKRLTIEWLRRKHHAGLDTRILHMKGDLRRSLTERGSKYQIYEVTSSSLKFGSSRPGAQAHQEGLGHMPKRPFIKFTVRDRAEFRRILSRHITEPFWGGHT